MKKKQLIATTLLAMKILTIQITLVVIFSCSIYAHRVTAQTLLEKSFSISVNGAEISKVIHLIEKQTGVKFLYSPEGIQSTRKMAFKVNGEKLKEFFSEILNPMNIGYKVTDDNKKILLYPIEEGKEELWILTENMEALLNADHIVSGTVVNDKGVPIEGVSIVIKGAIGGAVTDANGAFKIKVSDNKTTLVISSIGFQTQEIAVTNKSVISIKLISTTEKLEEVVVIGYGTQTKVTVTGSIASIKGDEIKATPTSSITNTLVGRMPGLIAKNTSGEPGYDDSRLLIRGNNTLGDNSPLIVVDGIADRAGGFSRIDANDIESVTILKDASAAIYGSRAANGVILVTTKRGKGGKTNISYTFDYGLKTPTILPKMLNSADYATALNDITSLIDKNPIPMYTAAEIQKFKNGTDPINYPNTNFEKEALKNYSIQKRHNLTISGGSEKVKYFTSIGYQYEDNMYKNSASNYNQYNLRSNIDIQATKDLKFFANLSLREEDRNSPWDPASTLWRNIVQGDPRQLLQYPNGLLRAVTTGGFNPLTSVDGTTGYQHNKATYINADLGFNWDFSALVRGLGVDGRLSIDKGNNFYKAFNKAWSLYTLDNLSGQYVSNQYGPTNAVVNENMNQNVGVTANIRLLYKRTFNKVHNFSTFVAYEQYENKYDYLQGQRSNYTSTAIDQLFAGDTKSETNNGSASQSARQNYFGRVDYSYADKYLLQFNWRYDGSENFPKANRFGFFPGVSLGWRASEENFWKKNLTFIDYFKVRGSYGKMGNDKINYNGQDQHFTYLTNYTFGNNAVLGGSNPVGYTGIVQVQTGNPNVTWEIATTYNLGFDAKFLKNAFNIEFDIFRQNRDNILAQAGAVVPLYAGISLPAQNVGSCESHGFEVNLGYTKSVGNLRLNVSGNMSYAKSKIKSFNEAAATPDWQKLTGKPIGSNWLMYEATGAIYRTAADLAKYPGLGNADLGDLIFKDVNKDGVLDGNDQVRLDKTETPEIIFGFNLGATYKQFELNMLWQGASHVWSYTFYEGGGGGIGNYTQDYFNNRWTPENPTATGPRIIDRERTSTAKQNTYFLQDATYLRLKNLQFSYTLPRKLLSKLSVTDCRIFVNGFNLLTFTGAKDIDPEATASGQSYAGWFNVQSKIYNFGINVTF